MPMVEVEDGVRLFAQDLGTGRPVVVLVAGFGLHHEVWDRQVRVLTDRGHRVICVDQRGHGRSDKPLAGYEVDRLAGDLITALERLGVAEHVLVGWSFGGQVAFRAAARARERVRKLVLVGSNAVRASRSAGFPFGRDPGPMLAALVDAEQRDRLAARRATIASGFGTDPGPRVVDWLVGCSLQMPSWAAIACYRSMVETDLTADLPAVDMPVLQVVGAADPVHSAKGARWLAGQLADARLVEIPGCGHYPMLEAPDSFDAALVEFVDAPLSSD
jgi:non-heme chloroperoxidase